MYGNTTSTHILVGIIITEILFVVIIYDLKILVPNSDVVQLCQNDMEGEINSAK